MKSASANQIAEQHGKQTLRGLKILYEKICRPRGVCVVAGAAAARLNRFPTWPRADAHG